MARRKNKQRERDRKAKGDGSGVYLQDMGGKENGVEGKQGKSNRLNYTISIRKNEAFELYYKELGIVAAEEWEEFLKCLQEPLPAAFRITGSRSHSQQLLSLIKSNFLNDEVTGNMLEPAKALSWYPNEMVWQLNYSRTAIRSHKGLDKLHQFLISETESGNISRQEAVSMLPPLLLDVQPHHKVLDMCAAPGSKTAQLIEFLHADDSNPIPGGFVIANDVDNRRCYLMVHQVKRLQSPNFMIVNHDASRLPAMKLERRSTDGHGASGQMEALLFDRVLADVPCSGDATARKNPDVWQKWSPGGGCHLHSLQLRILQRGLELLDVGGILVYSTCSFNPVENEAVVAAMLQKCGGTVEMVDSSHRVPALKYVKGLTSWKLMSKDRDWFETYEAVPKPLRTYIHSTMFPPSNISEMHLDRCIRLLPHHQDTGGFFMAALRKVSHLPWSKQANAAVAASKAHQPAALVTAHSNNNEINESVPDEEAIKEAPKTSAAPEKNNTGERGNDSDAREADVQPSYRAPPSKKRRFEGHREDPFLFLESDDPLLPPIWNFFDLDQGLDRSLLLVRSEEGKRKNLYLASPGVKNVVQSNYHTLKFVNLGVKCFARSEHPDSPCDYRLVQDGLSSIQHWIKSRYVKTLKEDVVTLLSEENPYFVKMSEATQKQLMTLGIGAIVFTYDSCSSDGIASPQIAMTGWRGRTSCRVYVPKFEREHYLRLCGQDPSAVAIAYGQIKKKSEQPTLDADKDDSAGDSEAEQALIVEDVLCNEASDKVPLGLYAHVQPLKSVDLAQDKSEQLPISVVGTTANQLSSSVEPGGEALGPCHDALVPSSGKPEQQHSSLELSAHSMHNPDKLGYVASSEHAVKMEADSSAEQVVKLETDSCTKHPVILESDASEDSVKTLLVADTCDAPVGTQLPDVSAVKSESSHCN